MGEKNILAYFKTMDEAQNVANCMKQMGISDIQVERIDLYPGGAAEHVANPITGQIGSLADLTLGDIGGDIGSLTAADTSASGMSNGGGSFVSGRDILLAAIVDESQFEALRDEIRNQGGFI